MTGWYAGRVETEDGSLFLENLYVADNWWTRFWGLQFQRELPPDTGLLLNPCSSVHTCFMRFSLNLVFLDKAGCVVECREAVPPWRFVLPQGKQVVATLEVPVSKPLPDVGTRLTRILPSGNVSLY